MQIAQTRMLRTFPEAWLRAVGFRPPVYPSVERVFQGWNRFCDAYRVDAARLTAIGRKYLGANLTFPDPPLLGFKAASLGYAHALDVVQKAVHDTLFKATREVERCRLGTVTWSEDGESCRFLFYEASRRRGLFREVVSRTPHEHQLVRARVRRVDDKDVKLPVIAQRIVNDLTPRLRRELRVVVGTEVVRKTGDAEVTKELTPLGRALVGVGKDAARVAAAAAPAMAAVSAAALLGAAANAGMGLLASAVFVADPALVLGNICLYGWEE